MAIANGESNWLRQTGFSASVGNAACASGKRTAQVVVNKIGRILMRGCQRSGSKLGDLLAIRAKVSDDSAPMEEKVGAKGMEDSAADGSGVA